MINAFNLSKLTTNRLKQMEAIFNSQIRQKQLFKVITACIFQNIHMIFDTCIEGCFHITHATVISCMQRVNPKKTHLMSHEGLYHAVENTSCILNSSFDDLTTGFFFFFFTLPLYFLSSPTENSTSFFFSHRSFQKQSVMR